ncbi:MAG: MerR family transcriptional regulator [Actinomycetota bacterium]|nr:MerR family transcriptional regulator [Actinomycetota bacterium]
MTAALTVGDFSRVTHLSIKTLRHYHQVGLLEPATVNPDTGYRYYCDGQIPTAQVIRRLRDLQMPVAEVKAVLSAPDAPARNSLIAAHLDRLEAGLAQTRAAVESLRNLLGRPGSAHAIEHRSVAATQAAGIGQVIAREDVLAWWHGALGELQATVRAQGLRVTGPAGGLYASELFQHGRGEATVFIPAEGSVRVIGRVAPVTIPAAELAVITHDGSLSDDDLSYGELGGYVTAHEISIDGPMREYYLCGLADTPEQANWRTEIGWPIFRADGSGDGRSSREPAERQP